MPPWSQDAWEAHGALEALRLLAERDDAALSLGVLRAASGWLPSLSAAECALARARERKESSCAFVARRGARETRGYLSLAPSRRPRDRAGASAAGSGIVRARESRAGEKPATPDEKI